MRLSRFFAVSLCFMISACGGSSRSIDSEECSNTCDEIGVLECAGNGYHECIEDASGCRKWGTIRACGTGQVCEGAGVCKEQGGTCKDDCNEGAGQCTAQGLKVCERQIDGCLHYSQATPCQNGQICRVNKCANCQSNSECDSLSVCANGRCALASGRQYKITFSNGSVPSNDNGSAWDIAGGAPDPFVTLKVDGTVIGSTRTISDSFTPNWNDSFTVKLNNSSRIDIAVYDEDVSSNDLIDSTYIEEALPFIKSYGFSGAIYSGSSTSLTMRIDPI